MTEQIEKFNKEVNRIMREMHVFHNTPTERAEARFAAWLRRDDVDGALRAAVRQAAYGFNWARQTGRLSGSREMNIRSWSEYERLKMIVRCALNKRTAQEVADYLNGKPSEFRWNG